MPRDITFAVVDALDERAAAQTDEPARTHYLTPIGNVPLISHVLAELSRGGIQRTCIVARDAVRNSLEAALGRGERWGLHICYADTSGADAERLLLAELLRALAAEPVLLHPGDCLFPGQISALRQRYQSDSADTDLVLLARRAPHAGDLATAEHVGHDLDQPDDEPQPVTRQSLRWMDTAAVLGAAARPALEQLERDATTGPRLIDLLLSAHCRYAICELGSHWCYGNSTRELLLGNQLVLDALPAGTVDGIAVDRSRLMGRVSIEPSARVSSSTVLGPCAIGDGAVVEDSFIGPYTAIGPGTVVRGAEIENAIVLAGAEIQHPGCRIDASVIGERARISRSFELPKGLHLRLGPGAQVTLS